MQRDGERSIEGECGREGGVGRGRQRESIVGTSGVIRRVYSWDREACGLGEVRVGEEVRRTRMVSDMDSEMFNRSLCYWGSRRPSGALVC